MFFNVTSAGKLLCFGPILARRPLFLPLPSPLERFKGHNLRAKVGPPPARLLQGSASLLSKEGKNSNCKFGSRGGGAPPIKYTTPGSDGPAVDTLGHGPLWFLRPAGLLDCLETHFFNPEGDYNRMWLAFLAAFK